MSPTRAILTACTALLIGLTIRHEPAHAKGVDDAEALLCADSLRAAAAECRELLDDRDLDRGERGHVLRILALALQQLDDVRAADAMIDAVLAEPTAPSAASLLRTAAQLWEVWGVTGGRDERLDKLTRLQADYPALRDPIDYLTAIAHDQRGKWKKLESIRHRRGVLEHFAVIGPFDNVGDSGMRRAYGPELAVDQDATMRGRMGQPLHWREVPVTVWGQLSTDEILANAPNALMYSVTHVRADGPTDALLHLAGRGSFRLWVNGELLLDEPRHREGPLELFELPVRLVPGWNQILVKIGAELEGMSQVLRLTTPDGQALGLPETAFPRHDVPTFAVDQELAPDHPTFAAWNWLAHPESIAGSASFVDRYLAAREWLDLGFPENAEPLVAALEEDFPGTQLVQLLRIDVLFANDSPEADAAGRDMWKKAPEIALAALGHARELRDRGDLDELYRYVGECAEFFRDSPLFQLFAGANLVARGETVAGVQKMEAALKSAPGHSVAQQLYLGYLSNAGENAKYRKALARSYQSRPDLPGLAMSMADVAYSEHDASRALKYLDRALQANASASVVGSKRAVVLDEMGRPDDAIAALRESLKWSPQSVSIRFQLVKLLLKVGRPEDAIAHLTTLLEVDPSNHEARELLRNLQGQPSLDEFFTEVDLDSLRTADLSWADSTAGACLLLDDVRVTVFESGSYEYQRHYALRVLNESGAVNYRTISEITGPRTGGELQISRCYRADGSVVEADVGEGQINFPDLAIGDVLEVQVRALGSPTVGLATEFWNSNYFSYDIPCLSSRYSLLLDGDRELFARVHNGQLVSRVEERGDWTLHEWEAHRVPADSPESYTPSPLDQALWLDVSTISDWGRIVDWYLGESEGRLRPTPAIERFVASMPRDDSADSSRIRAVATWVRENIEYEGGQFVDSPYVPRTCRDVLDSGYGDCKDQAGLIIAALRAMGIEAHYALVNARNVIKGSFLPSTRFSHAIVYCRSRTGQEYWIDPTADELGFPDLPNSLEEMPALIIDPERRSPFVQIPADPVDSDGTRTTNRGFFEADGKTLHLECESISVGTDASLTRDLAKSPPDIIGTSAQQTFGETLPGTKVIDWNFDVGPDRESPATFRCELRVPSLLTPAGNLQILRIPWTMLEFPTGLVALESRHTPLDLRDWRGSNSETTIIQLPPGSRPVSLPDRVVLDSDFGRFELELKLNDEGELEARKSLRLDRGEIEVDEYPAFREFLLQTQQAENAQLVLRAS